MAERRDINAATGMAVGSVAPADAERAMAVIVLAFTTDPIARWSYPDPRQFITNFPAIVRAFGGAAFDRGTAHQIGQFRGAALWLPPGSQPDEEGLMAAVRNGMAAEMQAEAFAIFEQMGKFHPQEPHWFLPLIGVDPAHQHKGYGAELLRHALLRCDRDRVPAYLESSNPANIALYERHGFEVLGTIQAGSSPPLFPMLRAAR